MRRCIISVSATCVIVVDGTSLFFIVHSTCIFGFILITRDMWLLLVMSKLAYVAPSIYYLWRADSTRNVSLFAYDPIDYIKAGEIMSFRYPADKYVVAPIWDCKVAIMPQNSTTSVLVLDLISHGIEWQNFTLTQERDRFATQLVDGSRLYVCGGRPNDQQHVCEVWQKEGPGFVDSSYSWGKTVGPVSNFTLHQVERELCTFGGIKSNGEERTAMVLCFNLTNSKISNVKELDAKNCPEEKPGTVCKDSKNYRSGHTSILYSDRMVVLCGGSIAGQNCYVLKISAHGKFHAGEKAFGEYALYHSKLMKWGEDILAFGVRLCQGCLDSRETSVIKPFAGLIGEPMQPLQHNVSEIQLFNIPTTCFHSNDGSSKVIVNIVIACGSLIIVCALVVLVCYCYRTQKGQANWETKTNTLIPSFQQSSTNKAMLDVLTSGKTIVSTTTSLPMVNSITKSAVPKRSRSSLSSTSVTFEKAVSSIEPGSDTSTVRSMDKLLELGRAYVPDLARPHVQTSMLESISCETQHEGSVHCMNKRAVKEDSEPVSISELPIQILKRIWRRQIKRNKEAQN